LPPISKSASRLLQAYVERREMLLRYFQARTRDEGLAEEIVQDLYMKIVELPPDYRVEHETAFLFRLAQNIWLNHLRARGRNAARDQHWHELHTSRLGADLVVEAPSAETTVSARQELRLLQQALADLPERTQQIFRLHKLEGLNQNEVAVRLGVSRSLVEKQLSAALRALMAKVRPREGT
jgi:RNA polymerase sigma-70 factor (ECF subfamily)